MTLFELLKKIKPFVQPYNKLVVATLALTAVGSFAVQINALILRYTVDNISRIMVNKEPLALDFTY